MRIRDSVKRYFNRKNTAPSVQTPGPISCFGLSYSLMPYLEKW